MQWIFKFSVVILFASFTSCLSVQPLAFEKAEHITINRSGDQTQISLDIAGHNPNNWSFKLTELQTSITINGQSFADLHTDTVMRLTKGAPFSIPVSMHASNADIMKMVTSGLSAFFNGGSIPLEVKGDFILKKFLFRRKFSFQLNEKIDSKMLK